MELGTQSPRTSIYFGALQGILAWTTYAITECWFTTVIPSIIRTDFTSKLYHWGFTFLLFSIYALIGMMLGGIIGLFVHIMARRNPFTYQLEFVPLLLGLTTFTIMLAFFANLVIQVGLGLSVIGLTSLFLAITIVLVFSVRSRILYEKFGFLVKPTMISIVLLGESWILLDLLRNNVSRFVKAGIASLYLLAVVFISAIIHNNLKTQRLPNSKESNPKFYIKGLAFLTVIALITLGVSAWINQPPAPLTSSMGNSPTRASLPNIILVVLDTVRADHLSLYGYERDTTPNLRAFAEDATLYWRAFASTDMTLSSHGSIFTGMYARRHGAHFKPPDYPYGRPLADKFETIAEVLSKEGYSTMAVSSNFGFLAPEWGMRQGFCYFDFRRAIPFLQPSRSFYLRTAIYEIFKEFSPRAAFDKMTRTAKEINSQVFKLVKKVGKGQRPLFLFINYMDAHTPYIPPHPFDTFFPGKEDSFTTKDDEALANDVMQLKRKITEREYRHLVSQYDGAIAYLDFHIGQLIEKLKKLDLYEKSLIIVTSDHGEAFGEKSLIFHGHSVYQNQIHIPLIIKYPGIIKKKSVDQLVSVVDIMPTILELAGCKLPDGVQGQSLLSPVSRQDRVVIAESFASSALLQWHPRFHHIQWAVLSGALKFIKSTEGKLELYNLAEDSDEDVNVYEADISSHQLEKRLAQWLEEVKEPPSTVPQVGKETLERLKALGYVMDKKTEINKKQLK